MKEYNGILVGKDCGCCQLSHTSKASETKVYKRKMQSSEQCHSYLNSLNFAVFVNYDAHGDSSC